MSANMERRLAYEIRDCESPSSSNFGSYLTNSRCQTRLESIRPSTTAMPTPMSYNGNTSKKSRASILLGAHSIFMIMLIVTARIDSVVTSRTGYADNQQQENLGQHLQMKEQNQENLLASPTIHSIPYYAPSDPLTYADENSAVTPMQIINNGSKLSSSDAPGNVGLKRVGGSKIVVEYQPKLSLPTSRQQSTVGIQNSTSRGPQIADRLSQQTRQMKQVQEKSVGNSVNSTKADERIATKLKFTFTVNGRQLALEPPKIKSFTATTNSPQVINRADLLQSESSNVNSAETRPFEPMTGNNGGSALDNDVGEGEETKKVNRLGEFASQSSDADLGFDVSSGGGAAGEAEQPNDISTAGRIREDFIKPTGRSRSGGGGRSTTTSMLRPSFSSSLMSPAARYTDADQLGDPDEGDHNNSVTDNESSLQATAASSALSSSFHGNNTGKQQRIQARKANAIYNSESAPDSRIISEWPKASAAIKPQQGHNADRDFAATSNPPRARQVTAPQARLLSHQQVGNQQRQHFSTLLSLNRNVNNDASGQPADQHMGNGGRAQVQAQKLTPAKQTLGANENDQMPTKGKTRAPTSSAPASSKSTTTNYPKAPVHQRSRHSPSSSLNSISSSSAPIKDDVAKKSMWTTVERPQLKSSGWENESGETIFNLELATTTNANPASQPPYAPSNLFGALNSTSAASRLINNEFAETSSPMDEVHAIVSSAGNQSEYAATHLGEAKSAARNGKLAYHESGNNFASINGTATAGKPRLAQRGLSLRMYPFGPNSALHLSRSLRSGPEQTSTNREQRPMLHQQHEMITRSSNSSSTIAKQPVALDNIKLSSIVRTGTIMPYPVLPTSTTHSTHLKSLVPAALALLAHAQGDPQSRVSHQFRALLAARQQAQQMMLNPLNANDLFAAARSSTSGPPAGIASSASSADQMIANANHLGVTHLNPQSLAAANLGTSESNSYNSIAQMQDYADRALVGSPGGAGNGGGGGLSLDGANMDASGTSNNGNGNNLPQTNPQGSSLIGDDQRGSAGSQDQYQGSSSEQYESSSRNQVPNGPKNDLLASSRISNSDAYLKAEHKSGDSGNHGNHLRSSVDPFEDISSNLATSEYERDLADLDEEFNRHTGFRRPSSGSLMSDSYMTLSPDRYEPQRYSRRPSYLGDFPGEYLSTAGSMSSIIPRPYQRNPAAWSPAAYGDSVDMWQDSNVDFSPLASLINPSTYSYRVRPRYHHHARQYPYATVTASSPYLATSASEQQLQPAYNVLPNYPSPAPVESISFTLSPLAAAAAAAATALAAADKTRHQSHAWLALPRLASTLAGASQATSSANPLTAATSAAPTGATAAALPAGAAYIQRPSPYVYGSMPIYAIAPRPAAPLATAASGTTPSIIPFYPGAGPAIIAYRPTGTMMPTQLLTAASFAYPLRLPLVAPMGATHTAHRAASPLAIGPPRSIGAGSSAGSSSAGRPIFLQDLQFAETKPKSNTNNSSPSSSSSSDSKGLIKSGGLSAMARNLTKKVFGSASQIRPQHVAPPSNFNELFPLAHNSSHFASAAAAAS